MNLNFVYGYLFSLYFFVIEIVCVSFNFTNKKKLCVGFFLEYVANENDSWF